MNHIETLLNNAFLTLPLSDEDEAMIAAYEYKCAMIDHAENLEDFDYWSIRADVSEVRA
jgi:hypothetical protein